MSVDSGPFGITCTGISSCLLGREVRFDGGHKEDRFLTGALAQHVEWAPVCPEIEIGMGVPREAICLVDDPAHPDGPRLLGARSGTDHTATMRAWARRRVRARCSNTSFRARAGLARVRR